MIRLESLGQMQKDIQNKSESIVENREDGIMGHHGGGGAAKKFADSDIRWGAGEIRQAPNFPQRYRSSNADFR